MTKRERFGVLMQMLAETYRVQVTPLMLNGYWSALSQYDEEVLAWAIERAISICKFMPTPADVRESIREVRANALGSDTVLLLEGRRGWTPPTPEQMEEIKEMRKTMFGARPPVADQRLPPGDRE